MQPQAELCSSKHINFSGPRRTQLCLGWHWKSLQSEKRGADGEEEEIHSTKCSCETLEQLHISEIL